MKIDVITVKLTCHIPIDLADPDTVQIAAERAKALLKVAKEFGQASMPKPHVARITAPVPTEPKPEPAE